MQLGLAIALMGIIVALKAPAQNGDRPAQKQAAPPAGDDWDGPPPPDGGDFPPPGFGPGGPGFGPGGPGFGPGGPGARQGETKLVKKFDKNGDGWLNQVERKAARDYLKTEQSGRRGFGPRGRFGPPGGEETTPKPGIKLSTADVQSFPNAPLYASNVLRTVFLEFEDADWEKELAEFKNTDVEVPAKLTVDGKVFKDVGVHFHGMSSFMMVGEGSKRSLVVSLDFIHKDQQLHGYRKLNLLNSHEDGSFLRTVLSLQVAREYLPAPKANFMRVVINGENWGIYVNQQHFNKEFTTEWFGTTKGARWKVPGSPGGRGGLNYLGDDVKAYKQIYEIKSKDNDKAWADLINLCKVLNETDAGQLEKKLPAVLDVDGALKFFAWENVLLNGDGFWTRASDYDLFEGEDGRFHIIPYDANETFSAGGGDPGGPGGPGGPRGFGGGRGRGGQGFGGGPGFGPRPGGGSGLELDPLVSLNDTNKPLVSKLLSVPAYKARYLGYVKDIAEKWLDWNTLGPIATQYHELIAEDVRRDTRKLDSTAAFEKSLSDEAASEEQRGFRGPPTTSLKNFAEKRRAFLLKNAAVQNAKL